MARKEITSVEIESDLTGIKGTFPKSELPDPVKVTVNGKSKTLDLFAADLAALESLVTGEPEEFRKLMRQVFGTAPAPARRGRPRGSGTGSGSGRSGDDGKTALMRAWADSPAATKRVKEWAAGLTANGGKATGARGRMPAFVTEDYDAAHAVSGVSTASGPSQPAA